MRPQVARMARYASRRGLHTRNGNLSSRSVLEHAERQWPSNPYLHMLSTPLRRCIVSHFVLPKAFMIQIKPVHLPSSEEHPPEITMAPDGILHPRFAMRKPGIGAWVTADQTVFKDLYKRQQYRMIAPMATLSPHLPSLITHQLQQRVLQEAELLFARVCTGALSDGSGEPMALVDDLHTRAEGKADASSSDAVPRYNMSELPRDSATWRDEMTTWITKCLPYKHGWLKQEDGVYAVERHRHTTDLCIALWRLATWLHSGEDVTSRATDDTNITTTIE